MTTITIERNVDEVNKSPSLYSMTGDIKHVNTMMVNRHALSEVLAHIDAQSAEIERLRAALAAPATVPQKLDPTGSELPSKQAKQVELPSQGQVLATAPDRHAQELLAMEITLQNMAERHAQELCAYELTVENLKARHKQELAAYEITVANLRVERDELLKLINRRKIHPHDFPLEIFIADLSTRTANVLRAEFDSFRHTAGAYDIEPPFTVRHLLMFSRQEIKKWPGIGKKGLNEIEENLRARGLQLWHAHDDRSLRLLREHKSYFAAIAKEGTP